MATQSQVNDFISKVVPLVQKYAKKNKYPKCVCAAIIAQACCESAYGTSSLGYKYHNYFGMKCGSSWTGKSVNMSTKEEYSPGTVTDIKANFRVYDNMDSGISGYFDFINKERYQNLKEATSSKDYLQKIKDDGYATNSTYVSTNYSIITKYNLEKYNTYDDIEKSSYYKKYTGSSNKIDEVFSEIGVPGKYIGNKAKRLPVAKANGLSNYSGSYDENMKLISLAKKGKLVSV